MEALSNSVLDHILYGFHDLEEGIKFFEEKLGISPVIGGKHIGFGTRNALYGMKIQINGYQQSDQQTYFEIIAPDPEQNIEPTILSFKHNKDLWHQTETFCCRNNNFSNFKINDIYSDHLQPIQEMTRQKTDGSVLKWKIALPKTEREGLMKPLFMDWLDTVHPIVSLQNNLITLHKLTAQVTNKDEQAKLRDDYIKLNVPDELIDIVIGQETKLLISISGPNKQIINL